MGENVVKLKCVSKELKCILEVLCNEGIKIGEKKTVDDFVLEAFKVEKLLEELEKLEELESLDHLEKSPGCFIFVNKDGEAVYVGLTGIQHEEQEQYLKGRIEKQLKGKGADSTLVPNIIDIEKLDKEKYKNCPQEVIRQYTHFLIVIPTEKSKEKLEKMKKELICILKPKYNKKNKKNC